MTAHITFRGVGFFTAYFVLLMAVQLPDGYASGPVAADILAAQKTCAVSQLTAAANLCQAEFNCDAKYVTTSATDPVAATRAACRRVAAAAFQKAYYASLAKAALTQAATTASNCAQAMDGIYLDENLTGEQASLSAYLKTGWDDTDAVSGKAYASLFKAAGSYCSTVLKAEAKNVLTPNPATLNQAMLVAGVKLKTAVTGSGALATPAKVLGGSLATTEAMVQFLRGNSVPTRLSVAGGQDTCVVLNNGGVKCWGLNTTGQLGQGDSSDRGDNLGEMGNNLLTVDLGTGRTAVSVSTGQSGSCAILDNGAIKCWGSNINGELGLGDTVSRGDNASEMGDNLPTVDLGTGRSARQIIVSSLSSCALLDNGSVKCWGGNNWGQLGQGDVNNRGDDPSEMGDSLPVVDLGTGRTARQISGNGGHVCALLDNGSVKCWGYNSNGQLGLGDTSDRGDNSGEMGDNLPALDLGSIYTAQEVIASAGHTCAVLDDGAVKCWGGNTYGQLGLGDTNDRGDNPGEMGNSLPAINFGTGITARQIALGAQFSCAVLNDNTVKCWGGNANGYLGQGDNTARGDTALGTGDNLPTLDLGAVRTAHQLASGGHHSCVILENHDLKCWGFNVRGDLGLGDVLSRGDNAKEMGFYLPAVDLGTP